MTDLLLEIARCPNVERCQRSGDRAHPCYEVVTHQHELPDHEHVLPEPWSGRLETAPILFVSSNPAIAGGELAPTAAWSDGQVVDFYANRFGGGRRQWIQDGVRNLRKDGSHRKHAVRFWSAVKNRAAELMGVPPTEVRPGIDYALTEVVHCNSAQEIGVVKALEECADRYLEPVLSASGAAVIVCLGVRAASVVRAKYCLRDAPVSDRVQIGDRARWLAFLPHPNAFKPKTFAKCIHPDDVARLRDAVLASRPKHAPCPERSRD